MLSPSIQSIHPVRDTSLVQDRTAFWHSGDLGLRSSDDPECGLRAARVAATFQDGGRPSARPVSPVPSRVPCGGHGVRRLRAIPARRAPPAGRRMRRGARPGPGFALTPRAAANSDPAGEIKSNSAFSNPPG